jgi:hypothetical protein
MTKVKANTKPKERLLKAEALRVKKRGANTRALMTIILDLPGVEPVIASKAVTALKDAADQYLASRPISDHTGHRSNSSLAQSRTTLAEINKHLSKVTEQFEYLPPSALVALSDVAAEPIGKLRSHISRVQAVTQAAQTLLDARPDKTPDLSRNILAYQVAVVFRDILKKTPSSTKASQLKANKSRGGAAYDRVMRATLNIAGVTNYDAGPLIKAGLRLLTDTSLPNA